jgi:hypothetical protein
MPKVPAPKREPPLAVYRDSSVWICAGVFLLANSLLSYGSFAAIPNIIIFLTGVVLPLGWAIRRSTPAGKIELFQKEVFPRIPVWAWGLLVAVVLGAHFYRLESLFIWPNRDEGLAGFYGIQLSENWNWRFFYAFGQIPPLSIWASAGLYKLGCSGFFSLWFPSAWVAVLTVGVAVLAARQFFSKSVSFILAFLFALGYWPFLLGRVCSEGIWLPIWVCACILFLGRFLKARPGFNRVQEASFLGLVLGLGSFTFTSWPVVVLWMCLVLFFVFRFNPSSRVAVTFIFIFFLLALIPFGWAVFREGYGDHIRASSFFTSWLSLQERMRASFSYFSCLFWGSLEPKGPGDPPSGGLLNPLLGSAFFLGVLELYRCRSRWMGPAIGAAFILFLLPGLLSMNLEMYRVVQVLPLLLVLVALGFIRLLFEMTGRWRWIFLVCFLGASLGIDGPRILNLLPDPSKPEAFFLKVPNHEDWMAYQIAKKMQEGLGPGLILSEWVAKPDESLFDMVYPFNAAENPRINPSQAKWAAVLMDGHYFPFVSPRLAGSQWVWLDEKNDAQNLVLGVVPMNAANRGILENWISAHHFFRKLNAAILNVANPQSYQNAAELLGQEPAFFQKDRFLEACYWERRGEFYYDYSYQAHLQDHLDALHQAIQKGYPAAHLYFKLGSLLLRKGDRLGAGSAFKAALKADPQYEAAQVGLNLAQAPALKAP